LWDNQTGEWIKLPGDSSERQPPREGGFTRWVLNSGCAVALADLVPPKDGNPVYPTSCYVGHLAAETLDFLEWTEPAAEDAMPQGPVNPDIFRLAGPHARVITDFAFPIFSGASEPGKKEVRAVLWAKCRRFFRAVLADEWCCLALFSKSASEALKVWRTLYASRAPARQMVLAYHFGERRGGEIAELLETNPHALEARLAEDVVCLNLDIRGSTGFTRALASQRRAAEFVSFFRDFHEMTHKAVLTGQGAFDKHTGDGAQALFNVFRGEVLPGYAWPSSDRVVEMQRALRCVGDVFRKWNELVRRHLPFLPIEPPHDFALGAGLAIGAVFVGGLYSPQQVPGFEYSAHGDAMNTAAKLQGKARANLRELLREACRRNPESILVYPRKEPITGSELEELVTRLGDRWRCILLMDIEFEAAIQETPLGFRFYRIPLEGPGEPMRILGILDDGRPRTSGASGA
jgi:class 3 adenylate cyclase